MKADQQRMDLSLISYDTGFSFFTCENDARINKLLGFQIDGKDGRTVIGFAALKLI